MARSSSTGGNVTRRELLWGGGALATSLALAACGGGQGTEDAATDNSGQETNDASGAGQADNGVWVCTHASYEYPTELEEGSVRTAEEVFEIDEHGNCLSKTTTMHAGGRDPYEGTSKWTVDENGYPLTDEVVTSNVETTATREYEYDSEERVSKMVANYETSNGASYTETTEYTYGDGLQLVEDTSTTSTGGNENTVKHVYEDGTLVSVHRVDAYGNSTSESDISYEYDRDASGNIVRMRKDDGTSFDFTYDANGNIATKTLVNSDGESSVVVTYEYAYIEEPSPAVSVATSVFQGFSLYTFVTI